MDGKKIFLKNILKMFWTFSVCACGKWICTSKKCPEKHEKELQNHQSIKNNAVDNEDDSDEYYDEDDEYYEEDPEDDPDVEDINWF